MDNQPVSFPEWKLALAQAGQSAAAEAAYRREIITFLKHCKTQHVPATVLLANVGTTSEGIRCERCPQVHEAASG